MRIVYREIFSVQVTYPWHVGTSSNNDFSLVPTRSTTAALADLALRLRPQPNGVRAYAEVEPDTTPPVVFRGFGSAAHRFVFALVVRRPALLNVLDLPRFNPARSVLCLDNLFEHEAGAGVLGDSVAQKLIGDPVRLLTEPLYRHRFDSPVMEANVVVRDRFDAVVAEVYLRSPDGSSPMTEYTLDLGALSGVVPGRYRIGPAGGTPQSVLFEPDFARLSPLAAIELFTRTEPLSKDAMDQVPENRRFVVDDRITGKGSYRVALPARATTWRYVVVKRYASNDVTLSGLAVAGPIAFSKTVAGDCATFTSEGLVELSPAERALELRHQNHKLFHLPNPRLDTPIQSEGDPPYQFISNIFVYV